MGNSASNFFDDIIRTLSIEAESAKFANIDSNILKEFFSETTVQSVPPPSGQTAPLYGSDASPVSQPKTEIPPPEPQQQHEQNIQPPPVGMSPADISAIAQMDMPTLHHNAKSCNRCPLFQWRKNLVFGAGNPQADLMFIGEGPGRDEDEQGIPFVGEAGQLMTKMINAMQFTRSDVYITNIVKCRPPKNRNPEQQEAETCIAFLKRQIELIQPKVIVLLGAIPLQFLMKRTGITRSRGQWLEYNGIKVMPTFHPAYLLRNPAAKKDVWHDLQMVMQLFGKIHSPVVKR
jgi:DNA polymerase